MSTNYYASKINKEPFDNDVHIGKVSSGWLFLFHKNEIFKDYNSTMNWLKNKTTGKNPEYYIINEYEDVVSFKEFKQIVDEIQKDPECLDNKENFLFAENINGYRFNSCDFI